MTILVSVSSLNTGVGQTPKNILITDTSTEISSSNVNRTSIFLMNLGRDDIWIACDAPAQFEKGMLLGAGGGSMLVDSTAFTTGPINGICRGNKSSTITSQELTK